MCLIAFAWRPGHPQPLVLAANRDEFHARSSLPLAEWQDSPGLYAGRDLQAGGTWLGVTATGRFAALTNIRAPHQPPGPRSRGELPVDFLRGDGDAEGFLEQLAGRHADYSPFNLLLGDRHGLYFFNSQEGQPHRLSPGVYGLSNASLDTPWPKVRQLTAALRQSLDDPQPERLLALLGDRQRPAPEQLPDTGVGPELETLLSSIFIVSPRYGTRASSVVLLAADGGVQMVERRFDTQGAVEQDVTLRLPASR